MKTKTFDQAFNDLLCSSQLHTNAVMSACVEVQAAHRAALKEKNRQLRKVSKLVETMVEEHGCPFGAAPTECPAHENCVRCIRDYARRKQ